MAAGLVMVLLQGLALLAILIGHGVSTLEESALLPLLGLAALVWGALGGALCQHVLSATLLATLLMAISWIFTVPFGGIPDLLTGAEGLFTIGAFLIAQNTYCRSDRLRLPERQRHATLRFLGRYLSIAVAGFVAINLLFHKQLLVAAEVGAAIAIVFALRRRAAGWQLILVTAGLAALVFYTVSQMLLFSIADIPQLFLAVELAACVVRRSPEPPVSETGERPPWLHIGLAEFRAFLEVDFLVSFSARAMAISGYDLPGYRSGPDRQTGSHVHLACVLHVSRHSVWPGCF